MLTREIFILFFSRGVEVKMLEFQLRVAVGNLDGAGAALGREEADVAKTLSIVVDGVEDLQRGSLFRLGSGNLELLRGEVEGLNDGVSPVRIYVSMLTTSERREKDGTEH